MNKWTRKKFVAGGYEITWGANWRRLAIGFCIRAFYLCLGAGKFGPKWLSWAAFGFLFVRFVVALTDSDESGGLF